MQQQIALSGRRKIILQSDQSLAVGCDSGHVLIFNPSLVNGFPVAGHGIGDGNIVLQVQEIHCIFQKHLSACLVEGNDPGRAVHVFKFQKPGMGRPVRIDKPVHAEVAVVRVFAVIPAVGVFFPAFFSPAKVYGVIAPFPYKSAAGAVILLYHLEIIFKIARAVAHGVAVFAHNVRLVRIAGKKIMDFFQRRIHAAVKIQVGIIILFVRVYIACAFVMGEPSRIEFLRPFQGCLKGTAVGAFISHGPDHDAWPVLVPVDTAHRPVQSRLDKVGIVSNRPVPEAGPFLPGSVLQENVVGAMAFIVSFIDDEEAVFVAELVELGRVGIMACPDAVHVMLLHEQQVLLYLVQADGKSGYRIAVVAVCAVEFDF